MAMPVRLLNSVLQGDMEKSGVVLQRFLINSTLGVYGFADIADEEFDIKRKRADFGQTLGKWGLGEGIYFCWPVFGPSNVRDSVGMFADSYSHPVPYLVNNSTANTTYFATNRVNSLSLNPDAYDDLKRYSVDPYVASRQAYYEYRQAIITHH
jgi:phospholipid-binding lipoprotein MlaA